MRSRCSAERLPLYGLLNCTQNNHRVPNRSAVELMSSEDGMRQSFENSENIESKFSQNNLKWKEMHDRQP